MNCPPPVSIGSQAPLALRPLRLSSGTVVYLKVYSLLTVKATKITNDKGGGEAMSLLKVG